MLVVVQGQCLKRQRSKLWRFRSWSSRGVVETVLKTVEVCSCSSSTRWPSFSYGGLAVEEGFFRRFYHRFWHSVRMDNECRLTG